MASQGADGEMKGAGAGGARSSGDTEAAAATAGAASAAKPAAAAGPAGGESVRVDAWIWSVRLVKTRSMGATACRGGHVRVNGERVKPAYSVRVGDEVRLRHEGRERVVVVKRVIRKRVGAPVAVECYADNSPRLRRARPWPRRVCGTGVRGARPSGTAANWSVCGGCRRARPARSAPPARPPVRRERPGPQVLPAARPVPAGPVLPGQVPAPPVRRAQPVHRAPEPSENRRAVVRRRGLPGPGGALRPSRVVTPGVPPVGVRGEGARSCGRAGPRRPGRAAGSG